MLFTFLEFGERMQAVTHIHHQHGITYVDVELFFRQPQIGGNTVQVTNNTVRISRPVRSNKSSFLRSRAISCSVKVLSMNLFTYFFGGTKIGKM